MIYNKKIKNSIVSSVLLMGILLGGCATQSEGVSVSPEKEPAPVVSKPKPAALPEKKMVLGWVENVKFVQSDKRLKAKLDSGATTSSVHAEIIRKFKRDDKRYVLFRVKFNEDAQETFEAPIERWVRIKTKEGDTIRRPVVKMTFCIGGEIITEEVNLADRENFVYPVLIGRNMLRDKILIDSSKTFQRQPECKNTTGKSETE